MSRFSYTAEGFRATFRHPALTLAEITWRWAVGGTGIALFFFWIIEYFSTLPVTGSDRFLLRTRHPYLITQAIAHIFRGNLSRVVLAGIVGALLLALLWIVAASLGRIATVRALLEWFHKDIPVHYVAESFQTRSLMRLNFLRAAAALAAVCAILGAAIVAGFASPQANPAPVLAFMLFVFLAGVVGLAWVTVNWTLSLAGMFAVRDGTGALDALFTAVAFGRERAAAIFAVSAWTGLAHVVAFMAATTVVLLPLAFAGLLPLRLVMFAMFLITLGYFAVVDWLYMARLAGYICIAETPEAIAVPAPVMSTLPALPIPLQTTIDRDELILSDRPQIFPSG